MEQDEVALGQARASHSRRQALFERQLLSEEDYESARNQLANAQVALKESRLNLAYADIRAPIAGMLMQRNVEIGDLVRDRRGAVRRRRPRTAAGAHPHPGKTGAPGAGRPARRDHRRPAAKKIL